MFIAEGGKQIAEEVLSVSQLSNYIESVISAEMPLQHAHVKGEITNFKAHSSGHLYFSIKDSGAKIDCVMFKSDAIKLTIVPKDGDEIIVVGRVGYYNKTGNIQIYAKNLSPIGIGQSYEQIAALAEELRKLGYFDEARKKAIPRYPKRVAIITSTEGAAIRDITSIAKRRAPQVELIICPVSVQGISAANEISAMVELVNNKVPCDIIIIGRGGGSFEDLSAFNERIIAEAIYRSNIPIISAVGHETDFTICDMASDRRAATPSAAAEMISPDRAELLALITQKKAALISSILTNFNQFEKAILQRKTITVISDPSQIFDKREMALSFSRSQLEKGIEDLLSKAEIKTASNKQLIKSSSHEQVLARGYAAFAIDGKIVDADDIEKGESFSAFTQNSEYSLIAQDKMKRGPSHG